MSPFIHHKKATPILLTLALVCFGLLPELQAVFPPPDGGYPGGNTAEGDDALFGLTVGLGNTAIGFDALYSNTEGNSNTATGFEALFGNQTGVENTAAGAHALVDNTVGNDNTATGFEALSSNTGGNRNTATGVFALSFNTNGNDNTATGFEALHDNMSGDNNSATGSGALKSNVDGNGNTATGNEALHDNDSGNNNSAIGDKALKSNTNGDGNTATGFEALHDNMSGDNNSATGSGALKSNTTGNGNTAIGLGALHLNTTGSNNTACGRGALLKNMSGSDNIALGRGAGGDIMNANDVICIGYAVHGKDVNHTTWIGNIFGVTTQLGKTAPVVVSKEGQLGTVASSERFKKDIATMEKASEAILSLRPVTFHYRTDTEETPQFGLIAEEVAKVNSALVLPDKEGKPYTVRYDAVNAMLLNEFLKEHRRNEEQQATITALRASDAKQEATIGRQQKQIEALTAGLQKVSAQLELTKSAPQTVLNDR